MYSFKVEQAIKAASVLHQGQKRKGKTPYPYVSHLMAVAMLVADYTDREDTIIAAFLHDTRLPKHTQHLSLIHISEPTRPY